MCAQNVRLLGLLGLLGLAAACKGEPHQDDAPQDTQATDSPSADSGGGADSGGDPNTQSMSLDGDTVTVSVDSPD